MAVIDIKSSKSASVTTVVTTSPDEGVDVNPNDHLLPVSDVDHVKEKVSSTIVDLKDITSAELNDMQHQLHGEKEEKFLGYVPSNSGSNVAADGSTESLSSVDEMRRSLTSSESNTSCSVKTNCVNTSEEVVPVTDKIIPLSTSDASYNLDFNKDDAGINDETHNDRVFIHKNEALCDNDVLKEETIFNWSKMNVGYNMNMNTKYNSSFKRRHISLAYLPKRQSCLVKKELDIRDAVDEPLTESQEFIKSLSVKPSPMMKREINRQRLEELKHSGVKPQLQVIEELKLSQLPLTTQSQREKNAKFCRGSLANLKKKRERAYCKMMQERARQENVLNMIRKHRERMKLAFPEAAVANVPRPTTSGKDAHSPNTSQYRQRFTGPKMTFTSIAGTTQATNDALATQEHTSQVSL